MVLIPFLLSFRLLPVNSNFRLCCPIFFFYASSVPTGLFEESTCKCTKQLLISFTALHFMMHGLGFSIYSNGCEKRTVCPLLFHSYLLFKHSFYIIPQFMVFLQVKFGFSILFKIFLTPQTRLFPGFFRSFSIFRKKNKKSACILLQSKIY